RRNDAATRSAWSAWIDPATRINAATGTAGNNSTGTAARSTGTRDQFTELEVHTVGSAAIKIPPCTLDLDAAAFLHLFDLVGHGEWELAEHTGGLGILFVVPGQCDGDLVGCAGIDVHDGALDH